MDQFLSKWGEAAYTSAGFFWMALWAFVLGYIVSSMIQVFVTRKRMRKAMGKTGPKSVALGTFFGFISSSCSFAALATTKSLFKKGAGLVPSLAFLLASTNLVIELGIVISLFLSWHFVVGEYIGGLLLIAIVWVFVLLTRPKELEGNARERLKDEQEHEHDNDGMSLKEKLTSKAGWSLVGSQYIMEWDMVWKDVTVGFTIAGVISAFVPREFFQTLFVGIGANADLNFLQVLEHTLVGPVAAFFTFIGSMGNIPLAAVLYGNGVSFAGVMAFIFSDLVVFPVLRINAKYYGWKMALYILAALLIALVGTSLLMHYGFQLFDLLPETGTQPNKQREFFKLDYTFYLNIAFLLASGVLAFFSIKYKKMAGHEMADKGMVERILKVLALASYVWLLGGLIIYFIAN